MSNRFINPSVEELSLLESLNKARHDTNALGAYHERQHGGSYGAISEAFVVTFTMAIVRQWYPNISMESASEIAIRIRDEIVDNGENVAYNIDLWNKGIINLGN